MVVLMGRIVLTTPTFATLPNRLPNRPCCTPCHKLRSTTNRKTLTHRNSRRTGKIRIARAATRAILIAPYALWEVPAQLSTAGALFPVCACVLFGFASVLPIKFIRYRLPLGAWACWAGSNAGGAGTERGKRDNFCLICSSVLARATSNV